MFVLVLPKAISLNAFLLQLTHFALETRSIIPSHRAASPFLSMVARDLAYSCRWPWHDLASNPRKPLILFSRNLLLEQVGSTVWVACDWCSCVGWRCDRVGACWPCGTVCGIGCRVGCVAGQVLGASASDESSNESDDDLLWLDGGKWDLLADASKVKIWFLPHTRIGLGLNTHDCLWHLEFGFWVVVFWCEESRFVFGLFVWLLLGYL